MAPRRKASRRPSTSLRSIRMASRSQIKGADWTLKRLTRDYQWFNSDGEWRYEAILRSAKIAQRQDRHRSGSTRTVFAPARLG